MTAGRRDQILAAARDLFLEGGLGALSMRRVAQRVGISATAIYRHYASKDALLAAVVEEGYRLFASELFPALEGATPHERLLRAGEGYLRFAFEQPKYYQVIFMAWDQLRVETHAREKHDGLPPTLQFLVDRVRECLAARGAAGDEDAFQLAILLWSQCHGLASLYLGGGAWQSMELEAYRSLCLGILGRLLAGLGL